MPGASQDFVAYGPDAEYVGEILVKAAGVSRRVAWKLVIESDWERRAELGPLLSKIEKLTGRLAWNGALCRRDLLLARGILSGAVAAECSVLKDSRLLARFLGGRSCCVG